MIPISSAEQLVDRRRGDRRKADVKFVLTVTAGMLAMYVIGLIQGLFFGGI